MEDLYLARQPIYDRKLRVSAYELLFRAGHSSSADVVDGDQATSQVLINTFMEFGLDTIVGSYPAFINLTRNFLIGDCPLPFAPDQVVLEVLEDIAADPQVVRALGHLSRNGFTIALDDFEFRMDLIPLLELAHIVKFDLRALSPEQLHRQVQTVQPYQVRLLAEKVETYEEFELCIELGFELFQGYFFCKPHVVQGRSLPPNRLVILKLLSKLQSPDADMDELEGLIVQDASLTYRLMRYINSASFAFRSPIESVRQALLLIGMLTIKNWVSLILLTRIEDKPMELMVTALVRARMCEQLARQTKAGNKDQAFTIGLFSALDAMMDRPMEQLLRVLPLSDDVKAALERHQGALGELLARVLDYEQGRWERLNESDSGPFRAAYLEAVAWADSSSQALK